MSLLKLGSAIAVAVALATPAAAQSISLDRSFNAVKLPWRNAGETILFYKVINMDGKAGVCATYISAGGSVVATEKQLLNAMYVKMGKTTVMNSLRHSSRTKSEASIGATKAKCKKGRKAWKAAYSKTKPTLKTSQSTFEY